MFRLAVNTLLLLSLALMASACNTGSRNRGHTLDDNGTIVDNNPITNSGTGSGVDKGVSEDFSTNLKEDSSLTSGANWAASVPGMLSASGNNLAVGSGTTDFSPSSNTTIDTDAGTIGGVASNAYQGNGVFDFQDVTVASGITVQVTGSRPLVIRATGSVNIAGIIDASGQDGQDAQSGQGAGQSGGAGVAGGSQGGSGGDISNFSQPSNGSQGAGVGSGSGGDTANEPGGGGGAGYGADGNIGFTGASRQGPGTSVGQAGGAGLSGAYANSIEIVPLEGGSGGGGGGAFNGGSANTSIGGSGGGGGGGAVSISAGGNVNISGSILCDGGNGGNGSTVGAAPGGGGSGGAVLVQAQGNLTLNGCTFSTQGGAGGTGQGYTQSANEGDGGQGKIRLESGNGQITNQNSPQLLGSSSTGTFATAMAYSQWYQAQDSGQPMTDPDYDQIQVQSNNQGVIVVEVQGAQAGANGQPDLSTLTGWSQDSNVADTCEFVRFRITLIANGGTPSVDKISLLAK